MVHRKAECVTPGRELGMRPGQVPNIFLLTLMVHGGGATTDLEQLRRVIGCGGGVATVGRYYSAWTHEMHRDAVLLQVPRGALPVLVEATRCVSGHLPISVMVTGGTLMLGGAPAAKVQPMIDATGARRWIPAVAPPVRLGT